MSSGPVLTCGPSWRLASPSNLRRRKLKGSNSLDAVPPSTVRAGAQGGRDALDMPMTEVSQAAGALVFAAGIAALAWYKVRDRQADLAERLAQLSPPAT